MKKIVTLHVGGTNLSRRNIKMIEEILLAARREDANRNAYGAPRVKFNTRGDAVVYVDNWTL